MNKEKIDLLEKQIEDIEKQKVEYLEADMNAAANRIDKKIQSLMKEQELLKYDILKKELDIYKEVVNKYPSVKQIVFEKINTIIKK